MVHDKAAGYKLIELGTLVHFDVLDTKISPSPDGTQAVVRIELQLGEKDEEGEFTTDVEWGALGFIFVLALLSFRDARPRGYSDIDFKDDDELTVLDLVEGLRFEHGELRFEADYIRGRCLKTDVRVRPSGQVVLETRNRGEAATRWLDRIKGKKFMTIVPTAGEDA